MTFDLKINNSHLLLMPSLWAVDQGVLHLLIRHDFCIKGRHDSDL